MEMRETLFALDGDEDYHLTKVKIPSLCNVFPGPVGQKVILSTDMQVRKYDLERHEKRQDDGGGGAVLLDWHGASYKTHYQKTSDSYSDAADGG